MNTPSTPSAAGARLTVLVSSTQRRGAEVFGEQLAHDLAPKGWDLDFVALADREAGAAAGVDADPLSSKPPSSLGRLEPGVVGALRRRVHRSGCQILLANGSATMQYSVAATRAARRRPVVVYASIGEPAYWARSPRQRLLYRVLLRSMDHVFSVSATTGRQLIDQFGLAERRLSVLHTGVPERLLEIPNGQRAGPLRVLFLGSLSPEKDPLAALDVIREAGTDADVALRVVGGGPLFDSVTAHAEPLADAVEVLGSVPDVGAQLEWADVLLLTSRTEGLPGVILEAAAAGVPAVAFDVGGVSETIDDGATGRVVPAGSVTEAAQALVEFSRDSAGLSAAGSAARQKVRSGFTMRAAIDRYDRALRSLLPGGPA